MTNETQIELRNQKLTYNLIEKKGTLDEGLIISYSIESNYGMQERGMEINKVDIGPKVNPFLRNEYSFRYFAHRFWFAKDNEGRTQNKIFYGTEQIPPRQIESEIEKIIQELKKYREEEIESNSRDYYQREKEDNGIVHLSWEREAQ